jgi:hypothetical protein
MGDRDPGHTAADFVSRQPVIGLVLGNVLRCLRLGGWMWRAHPELQREFAQAVDGTGLAPAR